MRTAAILLLFLPLSTAIFSKHFSLRHRDRDSQSLSTTVVPKCLPHTRTPCCMRLKGTAASSSAPREPDGFVQERLLEGETSTCGDSCHDSSKCMVPFAKRRERDGDAFDILPASSQKYEGCISASVPVWAPPTVVVGFGFKGSLAYVQRSSERAQEIAIKGLIALRIGLDLLAISPSVGGTFSVSWTFDLPESVQTFTSALGYVVRKYVWDKIKNTGVIRLMRRILSERKTNWDSLSEKIKKYEKLSTQPKPLVLHEADGKRTACLPKFEINERAEYVMQMEGIALVDEMARHIYDKLLLMQSWDDSDLQEEGSLVREFQDLRRRAKEAYATLYVLNEGESDYKTMTNIKGITQTQKRADEVNDEFWKKVWRLSESSCPSIFGNDYMDTIRATVTRQAESGRASKFKNWIQTKIDEANAKSDKMTKLYKQLFAQTYLDVFYPTNGGGGRATRLHEKWWQTGHIACSKEIDRGYELTEDTDITSEDIFRKEMRYQIRMRICAYNKGGFFDASGGRARSGRDSNLHDAAGFMFGRVWPTGENHMGLKRVKVGKIAGLWGKFSDGWSNYRGMLEAQMKDPPQSTYLGTAVRTDTTTGQPLPREYKNTEEVCEVWGYLMGASEFFKNRIPQSDEKFCLTAPFIGMVIALSKSHEKFIASCDECTRKTPDMCTPKCECGLKERQMSVAAVASMGTAGQDASNICQSPTLVAVDTYVEKSLVTKRVDNGQTCTYEDHSPPARYVIDLRVGNFIRFVSEIQSKTKRFTFEIAVPNFLSTDKGDYMSGYEVNYLPTDTPTSSSLNDLIGTNSEAFVEDFVKDGAVDVQAINNDFMIRLGIQIATELKRDSAFDAESKKLENEAFEGDNPVVKVLKALTSAAAEFMDEHVVKRLQRTFNPPTCVALSTRGEVDRIFEQLTSPENGPLRGFPENNTKAFNRDMLDDIDEMPMDCAKCDASDGACRTLVVDVVKSADDSGNSVTGQIKSLASVAWHVLGPVAEEILMPSSVYRLGVVVELDDGVVRTCSGMRTKRCETDSNCIGMGGTCNAVRICTKNPSTICTRPQDCDGDDNLCVLAEMQKCRPECVDTDQRTCEMCFSKYCEKNPAVDCTGSGANDHSRCRSDRAVDRGPCNDDGVCEKATFLKCRGEGVLFNQTEREACMWWPKSESQVGENPVYGASDKGKCVRSPRNDITLKFHAKTERKGTIDGGKMTGYLKKTGKYEIGVIKLNRRQTGHKVAKAVRAVENEMLDLAKQLPGVVKDGALAAGRAIKSGTETAGRAIKSGTETAGRAIKSGTEAVVSASKQLPGAIKSGAVAAVKATKKGGKAAVRAAIAASESLLFRTATRSVGVVVATPTVALFGPFVPAMRRAYIAQILRLSTELSTLAQPALGFFASAREAGSAGIAALKLYAECAAEASRAKKDAAARFVAAKMAESGRETNSTRQMALANEAYDDLALLATERIDVSNIDNLRQLRDDAAKFQDVMKDSDMATRIAMHCYGVKYPDAARIVSENPNLALSADAVALVAMASEDLIDLKLAIDSAAKLAASAAAAVETDESGNVAFLMAATGDDDDINEDDLERIVRKRNADALAKSDVAIKILKLKVSMLCTAAKEASPLESPILPPDLEGLAERVYLEVTGETESFFSVVQASAKSALQSAIVSVKEAAKMIGNIPKNIKIAIVKHKIKNAWQARLKDTSKELLTAMCAQQCQFSNPDVAAVENVGVIEAPTEDLGANHVPDN